MQASAYTVDDFRKDCKSLIDKAKAAFNIQSQKFAEALLQDGTKIIYEGDTPMPNMAVQVVDEKGNQFPLVDGNHVMKDGTMLIVKGGVIAEVQGKQPDAAAPAQTNPGETMQDDNKPINQGQAKAIIESTVKETRFEIEKAMDEKFKAVTDAAAIIETLKKELDSLKKENEAVKEKFSKDETLNKELFEMVKKIADEPADTSATDKSKGEKKDEKKSEPMKFGLDVWK